MDFPIFPFAPKSAVSVPIEVQRLSSDSPIRKLPPHGHLFFELLFITDGSGLMMIDGSAHAALRGSAFVIPPGMPHDARALGTASGWALMFTSDEAEMSAEPRLALFKDPTAGLVFDLFRRSSGGAAGPIGLPVHEMATMEKLLERIETEDAERLPGYEVAIRAALNLIMVQIGRTEATRDNTTRNIATQGRALLARAFEYIDRHFSSDPSLESAAHQLRMTPAHLTTRIRRLTGRTYGDWIIERRMIEARHRLVTTSESLAEISATVGYRDTESFIRRFRAHHGMTPAQWRDKARPKDTGISPSIPAQEG